MPLHINFMAVLIAVVINFILGFIWYAALFAKPWTKEMGYDSNMRPDKKAMMKGMALMVIGNFLLQGACILFSRVAIHSRGR